MTCVVVLLRSICLLCFLCVSGALPACATMATSPTAGSLSQASTGLPPEALTGVPLLEQARPAADGAVVYLSDRSGAYEVWQARAGTELQLSALGEVTDHPRVAPNGRTVVFSADRGGGSTSPAPSA